MKVIFVVVAGVGLFVSGAPGSNGAPNGQWQRYGDADYVRTYDPLRAVVNQTQQDLREAADLERHKGDPHARYSEAQGHLSSFDRKLTQGRFDNGELKKSIEKLRSILDKNVLQVSSRDALLRDLDQLERSSYRGRY